MTHEREGFAEKSVCRPFRVGDIIEGMDCTGDWGLGRIIRIDNDLLHPVLVSKGKHAGLTLHFHEKDMHLVKLVDEGHPTAAEAKLADIKAVLRVHALGLMTSPDFKSAIERILE